MTILRRLHALTDRIKVQGPDPLIEEAKRLRLAASPELDPTTPLSVKCVKGRQLHLWRRIGGWRSPYWVCAYCHVPCCNEYRHEGTFDTSTAMICDEIVLVDAADQEPAP